MKTTQSFILLLLAAVIIGAIPQSKADAPEHITVVAKRYSFEPAEITVHKGQPVTLEVTTTDVTHGIEIKELGIKAEVKKGKPAEVSFTPETVGTFTGKCSHFCGMGHGSMNLKIHVIE